MSDHDMSLIPTQDVLNELKGRFEHMVFKGQRKENSGRSVAMFDWHGEHAICLGLCAEVQFEILNDRRSSSEELGELP